MTNRFLKNIATLLIIVATLSLSACSSDDSPYIPEEKRVSYAFTFNEVEIPLRVDIKYIDYEAPVTKGIVISSPENWQYSYTSSTDISPAMTFKFYMDDSYEYKASEFPTTIGFTSSVAYGVLANNSPDELTFDTLEKFSAFIADDEANTFELSVAPVN